MKNDYAPKQAAKDHAYLAAYQSWVAGLPPEERAKLESLELDKAQVGYAGCGMPENDLADSPLASEHHDPAANLDSVDDLIAEYPQLQQVIEARARQMAAGTEGGELLRRLALMFIDEGRRALNADCLAWVSGLAVRMGESGHSIARKHGISRQAFHKRCNELRDELGLAQTRAQKSDAARRHYRLTNRKWHGGKKSQ
jgi:hypothetical protein